MAARSEYDLAEAAALAEAERAMGPYISVFKVTRQQYVNQLAGPAPPAARTPAWQHEHDRRAACVAPILDAKLTAARKKLEQKTLTALAAFFRTELKGGRITAADYDRYTVEIRRGYFPRFRARKWSGPAIYELRGASASPEYQKV